MRILASNPDTIGDMVLRQPMYRALTEAGHKLTLVVRSTVAPLVPYVAPGADLLVLPSEVYCDDLELNWGLFEGLFVAARRARPEGLLVAPFRWTRFEERLVAELREAPPRRFGMSGGLYAGDPALGRRPWSRLTFDVTAKVGPDEPEVKKNATLAAAVLGVAVESLGPMEPVIEPDAAGLDEARRTIARLGLEPNGYWMACVAGTVNVAIKNWHAEHWARVLSHWSRQHGRRFLFTGLPSERGAVEQVLGLMDREAAEQSRAWMDEGSTLGQLIALTVLASGYAGHDTGPMHIAAALGKPVLAVFGGGTWPRFVPAGRAASVAVTVSVGCAGCGWSCPFKTSHCIKAVGVDDVARAADDLEAGRVAGHEIRMLDPGQPLRDRMVREAALFARERMRDAGDHFRELRKLELAAEPIQTALEQRSREAALLGASVERLTKESADLAGKLKETETQAAWHSAEWVRRTREAEELRRSVSAREQEAERLRRQVVELERAAAASRAEAGHPAERKYVPWRQRVMKLITGPREFVPRRAPRPLPKITLVTPIPARLTCDCPDCREGVERGDGSRGPSTHGCRSADIAAVRRTIECVLAQGYPRLDYMIAPAGEPSDGAGLSWLEPYTGRLNLRPEVAGSPFDAIAQAFDASDADVIGWLAPGDVLEPGALRNVGEFFRDHPRSAGAVFDDTAEIGRWRVARPRPRMDVDTLLADAARSSPSPASIFVRRRAYRGMGRFNVLRERATAWDFCLRFSRRHGFARARVHVACRLPRPADSLLVPFHLWPAPGKPAQDECADWRRDMTASKQAFEAAFGLAGRARAQLVHRGLQLGDWLGRLAGRERLVFPLSGAAPQACVPGREGVSGEVCAQPNTDAIGPMIDWQAARLVFSPSGAGGTCPIYYDPRADVAYTTGAAAPGGAEHASPCPLAGHRPIHVWERGVIGLPCLRKRLASTTNPANESVRLLSVLSGLAFSNDRDLNFLHVGAGEGQLLHQLRPIVRWQLAGTEQDPGRASIARADGFEIWDADPFDAANRVPVGRPFDVVFFDQRTPRGGDLVTTLRRLRQLLKAGGLIVLSGANLDSRLLDLFGPTWPGWRIDRPLTIPGRRGAARLAQLADLRLTRFSTFTDTAAGIHAVQQSRLRRIASPPSEAPAPEDRHRGRRLTAWANLLWDWRGKGDAFYAVLHH